MENNKLCNWLLYYSKQDTKVINSEIIIDVETSVLARQRLCSNICYFECGNILFDDFPDNTAGFAGIFDYLMNDRGNVMDKMKSDEQRSYIIRLSDSDNFSIRHHVSIIKCLMKCYVCRLAPWDRIKRALDSLGSSRNIDETRSFTTFRQTQQNLIIWLREAATKGLLRLMKKSKTFDDSQMSTIINNSTLGSLVLYAMLYYAQTKMIKYNVAIPDADSLVNSINNNGSKCNFTIDHSRIVLMAFSDICDNVDIFPLQSDCLLSTAMDTVPSTLIIALTFHWTFGNSLKNLDNLLKSSYSSTNSSIYDKSPGIRPTDLPIPNNTTDIQEQRPFFMNNNQTANAGLNQIFSKVKNKSGIDNGASKSASDGDTSPEIFLTPTEDEIPMSFVNPITPPIKLLSYRTVDTTHKSLSNSNNNNNNVTSIEPLCLNLKEKFQKKRKEELSVEKTKPKVNIVSVNETTWMAQSNKNETVPLTPKKAVKPVDTNSQNGASQSLTKGQLSDIQIKLSLQRKKIESSKKDIAKKTEKNIESHKQKAFFQAFDKVGDLTRRKSLELVKGGVKKDTEEGDRRSSMYVTRSDKNEELSQGKKLMSEEVLESFVESPVEANDSKITPQEYNSNDSDPPQSSRNVEEQIHPLEVCLDDVCGGTQTEVTSRTVSLDKPSESGPPRKNSSPSISSLSSASDLSEDKHHVTKDEYQKSIDLLSTSLTNLQEEIRFLSNQQLSWNSKLSHPVKSIDSDDNNLKSESNSVAETPTNITFFMNEISPKSTESRNDGRIQRMLSVPISEVESITEIPHVILSPHGSSLKDDQIIDNVNPIIDISPLSQMSSPGDVSPECKFYKTESIDKSDCLDVMSNSINETSTEDESAEMSSSSDSVKISNVQPVSFFIAEENNNEEALRKKAELLAKREQRRLLKLEMFRQRREQDRENRLSAANEELLERELKKRLEQEKRDSLLKKYLDRRNEESAPVVVKRSSSTAGTPVKTVNKSQTLRPSVKTSKQDSMDNLTLAASPQRNGWFSSMRQNHRMTSSSTSQLNSDNGLTDSVKFGVPLPPQEYQGPKLFGKRKVKTNRSVIANAIAHCCLAGSVNIPIKETVLKELADADGTHFMILFRDSRCQYRSVYVFDLNNEDLNLIVGTGPKRVTHEMVEKFYKYNSGAKQFNPILSTKHLSPAVDAICIQSIHWNTRPASQLLSGAVSTSSISQTRNKRIL